ncbi:MAG: alpha-L-arabinofuranosidase C-terminal domain-containing protein [Flavisolibacter sp.]
MRYFFLFCFYAVFTANLQAQNEITLNSEQGQPKISRFIYGHFAEHLGNLIYGGLYVGDTSHSIAHTGGIRNDIIAALKKMKIPVLRWPGGCFADTYHWKDGVGPKKKRPTMVNTNWGGVTEDNSFGTHDFLTLCELVGAEPYFSGNVGSGVVQELADWVQYVNFEGKSPMSDYRRENGRDKPWKVRYWGIGNEAWGCGGNMTAEHYADVYRTYATFIGNVSSQRVFRIASGASDADYHWTETLMKNIPHYMLSGLALHHYSVINWNNKGSATDFSESQYFTTMQKAFQMEEMVRKHASIMDQYDPQKKIALVVDEWGGWYDVEPGTNPGFLFQQNTMRDAMIAGLTLNIFNNHCDRVRMANLAQVVNVLQAVILTHNEKLVRTPTYHVMEMFNIHQDATLIPITLKSQDYVLNNATLPAISASASLDSLGYTHISVVNIDAQKDQNLTINLSNKKYLEVKARILKSAHIQDYNSFTKPDQIVPVAFQNFTLKDNKISLVIPAFSVVVLALK